MKPGLFYSAIAGLTGVLLGAFGAHMLKDTLIARGALQTWQTAVFYQLTHSVAALVMNLLGQNGQARDCMWLGRAGTAWLIGIALFSGSLYLLALGGPKWLGPVTPLGGLFLLAGWVCVLIGSLKSPVSR